MTSGEFINRGSFPRRVGSAAVSLLAADSVPASAGMPGKPNVLFIICDDLNDCDPHEWYDLAGKKKFSEIKQKLREELLGMIGRKS